MTPAATRTVTFLDTLAVQPYAGRQQLHRIVPLVTAENHGAEHLCLVRIVMEAGERAAAHHHDSETAIIITRGVALVRYGPGLAQEYLAGPGTSILIPPRVPHMPICVEGPLEAYLARTDPHEQETVELLPELER
jgi:uncharacterized RmlC-like cupin family protein